MDENSHVVNELRSAAETIAQSAVARGYARQPSLLANYGERDRDTRLQDARVCLTYLADATSFGRPSIFKNYIGWISETLAARGVASEELTESLKCVREVLVETFSGESLATVCRVFDAGLASAGGAGADQEQQTLPANGLAKRYLDFLLSGDRRAALELIQDTLRAGMDIKEIWLRVFQDSQYELGRLWRSNKISIAHEHYCTAATQAIMSRLYGQIFSGPRNGRVMVTTCAPDEIHELGMRMVADFFEIEGWDTYHLGADTPSAALIEFVAHRRPNLLGLSATTTPHLKAVAEIVRALRSNQETQGIGIMVGGHAFNLEPDLWRDIGADGYACDAEHALVVAGRLAAIAKG